MPSVKDGVVRISGEGRLSDGFCMRREHLPRLLTELREVQRQDYERDIGQNKFESGATLNVRGTIEDGELAMTCNACGQECDRRSILMYTFPDGNTARTVSYCVDCTEELIDSVADYIDGREHELLGDTL